MMGYRRGHQRLARVAHLSAGILQSGKRSWLSPEGRAAFIRVHLRFQPVRTGPPATSVRRQRQDEENVEPVINADERCWMDERRAEPTLPLTPQPWAIWALAQCRGSSGPRIPFFATGRLCAG
jgi:hypothetical protein